jgi:hypothetical protein
MAQLDDKTIRVEVFTQYSVIRVDKIMPGDNSVRDAVASKGGVRFIVEDRQYDLTKDEVWTLMGLFQRSVE